VTRKAGESIPAASWVVARRYSAFHDLHKRLKARYPAVKHLEFPRRQMPMLNLQRDFLERRRIQLERYLKTLLENPAICRSRELRAFLSQQQLLPHATGAANDAAVEKDFVTRIYNSVTDGMEEFLGNVPVLDQLSVAGQNLISAATSQLSMATATQAAANKDVLDVAQSAEAEAELAKYAAAASISGVDEPFVKPLCDLFLEVFELNRQSNWLRGRAVVFVLQQLLGGTVERRVRDTLAASIFSPPAFTKTLDWALNIVWPGGGPRFTPKPRTAQEKEKSRKEASYVLAGLIPELVGSVVGRQNATGAARRLLAMVNNERVFGDLIWRCVDEVVAIVWGEGVPKGI
jgi:sorting nexin-25